MESAPLSDQRAIAELAVQRAAVLTKKVMMSVKGVAKCDSTPVTVADFAAQALLISALRHVFPHDRFVGEENADALRQDDDLRQRVWELVSSTHLDDPDSEALLAKPMSEQEMLEYIDLGGREPGGSDGRFWVMDPIDGTATFLRGGQYAVALALVVDGKQVIGVMGCPNISPKVTTVEEMVVDNEGYGMMLSAVRGQGVVARSIGTGSLLPANAMEILEEYTGPFEDLNFVDSSLSEAYHLSAAKQVANCLGASFPGTDIWSTHVRYAALCLGSHSNYVQIRIPKDINDPDNYIWDYAGAQLIFQELGGRVTDLHGMDIDFGAGRRLCNNVGIIAAVGGVHERLRKVIREILDAKPATSILYGSAV